MRVAESENMSTTRNLLLGASLLSTFACTARLEPVAPPPSETSSKYEIADISPSLSAQSDGAQITVYAALFKGGAFLELSPGDTLTGTVGSETHTLAEVKEGESIHYTATFAQPATPVQATVSFARADGRRGGDSTVLVPAPFTVATAPATVSHQGSVSLTLTGIGVDELDTEVRGVCVKDGESQLYSPVQAGGARLDFRRSRSPTPTRRSAIWSCRSSRARSGRSIRTSRRRSTRRSRAISAAS